MRIKKTASLLAAFGLAFSLAACGGDGKDDAKVTKEEFTKGYVTGMKSVFKRAPETQLKQLAECTYQKINGKVDDSTMKIIAKGNKSSSGSKKKETLSAKDHTTLQTASKECASELIKSGGQNSPSATK